MRWNIKYLDNQKIKFIITLNPDLSLKFIGAYNYNGNWYEIKSIEKKLYTFNEKKIIPDFQLTKENVTEVVMELLEHLIFYEQNLDKMREFFDDYKSIEFVE